MSAELFDKSDCDTLLRLKAGPCRMESALSVSLC